MTNQNLTKHFKMPNVNEALLVGNPFANELTIRVNSLKTKLDYISVEELSIGITNKTLVEQEIILEKDKYTKLYNKAALRLHIFEMSEKSRSLYLWLMYEIESGKDFIWINKLRYMKEADVSLNTYKAAIVELITKQVITPTMFVNHDYYWVNPTFFFNGNRIKKYPNNLSL